MARITIQHFSGKVRFFREKYDFFSTPKMAIWGQLGFKCQLGVIWGLDVRWVSVEYRFMSVEYRFMSVEYRFMSVGFRIFLAMKYGFFGKSTVFFRV